MVGHIRARQIQIASERSWIARPLDEAHQNSGPSWICHGAAEPVHDVKTGGNGQHKLTIQYLLYCLRTSNDTYPPIGLCKEQWDLRHFRLSPHRKPLCHRQLTTEFHDSGATSGLRGLRCCREVATNESD
ncbi:protein of unknown function [Agreia sp. COWG]|jgi:hypothetical protein|nr:protein of unknown function [Agreia sp. COWG]